jgi:hypothetical protein
MHPEDRALRDQYYPLLAKIVFRDGYECACCKRIFALVIDHIQGVKEGGITTLENLQLLCHRCNKLKAGLMRDYRPSNRGRLGYEKPHYTQDGLLLVRKTDKGTFGSGPTLRWVEAINLTAKSNIRIRFLDNPRSMSISLTEIHPPDLQHLFEV